MSAVDPTSLVGTTINNRYTVGQLITSRDHCPLFHGREHESGSDVSLRFFLGPPGVSPDVRHTLQQNFVRAANTMAYMSRMNEAVVRAAAGAELAVLPGGLQVPFAVLEPVHGASLAWHLATQDDEGRPGLSVADSVDLLEAPMRVVAQAHDHGIVHRHIEPANFWVFANVLRPRVKIKLMGYSGVPTVASIRRESEAIVREPYNHHYAAPEQFLVDEYAIGPWTDVYGMAIILIEVMRGGRQVVQTRDVEAAAVASADPHRRPTPRALGLAVSDAVEKIFWHALVADRMHRFRAMGEFCDALQETVRNRTQTWTKRAYSSSASASGSIEVSATDLPDLPDLPPVVYHGDEEVLEMPDRSSRETAPQLKPLDPVELPAANDGGPVVAVSTARKVAS
ncbi:MAG: hypothetical protein V3V08_06655 [Nannocystaceae bacterium]